MIDFSEIRKEVAIEHNILLDQTDPMLISVTFNKVIFEKYVQFLIEKNAEQNKVLLEAIKKAQQQGIADAKVSASRLITEGGDYLEAKARDGLTEVLKDAIAQHKEALGKAWREIEASRKTVLAAAVVSCSCALITIITVIKYTV